MGIIIPISLNPWCIIKPPASAFIALWISPPSTFETSFGDCFYMAMRGFILALPSGDQRIGFYYFSHLCYFVSDFCVSYYLLFSTRPLQIFVSQVSPLFLLLLRLSSQLLDSAQEIFKSAAFFLSFFRHKSTTTNNYKYKIFPISVTLFYSALLYAGIVFPYLWFSDFRLWLTTSGNSPSSTCNSLVSIHYQDSAKTPSSTRHAITLYYIIIKPPSFISFFIYIQSINRQIHSASIMYTVMNFFLTLLFGTCDIKKYEKNRFLI